MASPPTLADLLADPGQVDQLGVDELVPLLDRCAVEHDRVTALERLVRARLCRELPTLLRADEGLLTAAQAARRLGVSPDYVRDHGEELGIVVMLPGALRYHPVAVEQARRARQPRRVG